MSPETVESLARGASALLGPDVRARACSLAGPIPELYPEEEAPSAVEKRRRELAFGRSLARELLAELGRAPQPILRRSDRAPVWPPGVWGSITHTDEVALVALSLGSRRTFGLDLELAEPLGADLVPYILRAEEQDALGGDLRLAKVVFSVKEAFYKAQHAHTGVLLDFLDVEARLDEAAQTVQLTVHHEAKAKLPPGPYEGAWRWEGSFVLSAATVARPPPLE